MPDQQPADRRQPDANKQAQGEPQLKGAFASVLLLGAFIAVTWTLVFVLYIARN